MKNPLARGKSSCEGCFISIYEGGITMSTREKLFTALDMLSDEQIEALYTLLNSLFANTPNNETIAAMRESDRIAHDTNVQGYTDMRSLREALDAE